MKHIGLLAAAAALMMTGISCSKIFAPSANNPYKSLNLTTKASEYVSQGNTFAFEFLDRVSAAEEGDFIISPLSMQFLLGMLLNGARGETADEICSVLGYGAGEVDDVNEYCLSMLKQLPSLDKQTTLTIADAIFVNNAYPLLDSYRKTVSDNFLAEVENLDFSDQAKALKTMNGWCNKQSKGLIPKVIDEVDASMLAFLFNAVYFKSEWKEKFPKSSTSPEQFTAEDGSTTKVSMMKNEKDFLYQENDDLRVVRLPYGNGAFWMEVVLPQDGKTLSDVTAAMKTPAWDKLHSSMVSCDVDLWLPKFKTEFSRELNDLLSDMGMPSAFDPLSANFKAMSDFALCLDFIKQDAVIIVDEEGTEAAAISSAGIKATAAAPGEHIVFHADRPFIYLISESSSGAVLFAGRFTGKN